MISVQAEDFNTGDEYASLVEDDLMSGAVVLFVGRVREMNLARHVQGLQVEHYPGMTEKVLSDILCEVKARWDLIRCRVIHRIGKLDLGDQIVLVGVTSIHREHAFAAAEFLMDYLKTKAPFWKKEIYANDSLWLEANEKDLKRLERWE